MLGRRPRLTKEESPRFLMYWPFGTLNEVHLTKDIGALPTSFAAEGWRSTLLVGRSRINDIQWPVSVLETGIQSRGRIRDNIVEFLSASRAVWSSDPQLCLIYARSPVIPLVIVGYKLCSLLTRRRTSPSQFILKMDWDGEWNHSRVLEALFPLFTILSWILFDAIIVETVCAAKALEAKCVPASKLHVVPNGYDPRELPLKPHASAERGNIILYAGRIHPDKGVSDLLEAFIGLSQDFPSWNLEIVGPVADANFQQVLCRRAESAGLANRVRFYGEVPRATLLAKYRSASIFALLSYHEGYPLSRIEALACGAAIVTSEAGCGRELEGKGALVVPRANVPLARCAMKSLMSSVELRNELVRRGQGSLQTWSDIMKRLIASVR